MEDMSKCRGGDLSGKLEDVEIAIKHLVQKAKELKWLMP
jgi:hypothetical protein